RRRCSRRRCGERAGSDSRSIGRRAGSTSTPPPTSRRCATSSTRRAASSAPCASAPRRCSRRSPGCFRARPRPAPPRREAPRRRFLDGPRRRRYFGKVPVRAARASAGPLAARAPPHPPPQERAMGLFGMFGKKEEPKKLPPKALPPKLGQLVRPPPKGRNNYVIVILDSCRFDSFIAAQPKTMLKLGEVEKRYSYASWTAPSHYNLLMGLVPHRSPPH